MPQQTKEPVFDYSDLEGRVFAQLEKRNADSGDATYLLLLAILRELEKMQKQT